MLQPPYLSLYPRGSRNQERTQGKALCFGLMSYAQSMMLLVSQSVYDAVLDIIRREGILGLYSGLNSSLLGIAVTNG